VDPSSTLSKGGAQAPFFSFFSFCFVSSSCKWAPLPTFDREGAQAPSFFLFFFGYLWVQVGAITKFW
jgi:hypothetical protein